MGVDRAAIVADPGRGLEPDAARRFQRLRGAARAARAGRLHPRHARASATIELEVDPRVLIPRPETEHLVEAALDLPARRARGRRRHRLGRGRAGAEGRAARPATWSRPTPAPTRSPWRGPTRRGSGSTSSCCEGDLLEPRRRPARRRRSPTRPTSPTRDRARSRRRSRATSRRWRCSRARTGSTLIRRLLPARGRHRRARWSRSRSAWARPTRSRSCMRDGGLRRHRDRAPTWPGSSASWWAGDDAHGAADAPRRSRAASRRRRRRRVPGRHRLRARLRRRTRRDAVERLYALKGRRAGQARRGDVLRPRARVRRAARARAAHARAARAAAARRGHRAAARTRCGRFPLACGPDPHTLGLRVPDLAGAARGVRWPVLQSSANHAGGPTRGGSTTCRRRSAATPTSCSTAASCPARRRRSSTCGASSSTACGPCCAGRRARARDRARGCARPAGGTVRAHSPWRPPMTDLQPDYFERPLADVDPEVAEALDRELERQRRTLEMIASENFVPAGGPRVPGQRADQQVRRGLPRQALLRRLRVRRRDRAARDRPREGAVRRRARQRPAARRRAGQHVRLPRAAAARATRSWASRCRTAATSATG